MMYCMMYCMMYYYRPKMDRLCGLFPNPIKAMVNICIFAPTVFCTKDWFILQ